MVSRKVVVSNPTGLHLRPAGLFCKTAVEFRCSVKFRTNKGESNAKSVLSVLGACVKCGDELEIICDGEDEKQALETMVALVESGLGEYRQKNEECDWNAELSEIQEGAGCSVSRTDLAG